MGKKVESGREGGEGSGRWGVGLVRAGGVEGSRCEGRDRWGRIEGRELQGTTALLVVYCFADCCNLSLAFFIKYWFTP